MNRKIKNAEKAEYNGVIFRSKLELQVYKVLIENGFTPKYETQKFVLFNGFKPQKPLVINGIPQINKNGTPKAIGSWTYSPDFIIEYKDNLIYIEVKGFPNDVWPYKRKLFLKEIENIPNTYFYEVKNINGLLKTIELIKQL